MEIHFEIENKCLLTCRHCSSYASNSGREMNYSVSNMVSFLRELEGKREVFLTGGEPLLYPAIEMLLKHLYIEVEEIVLGMFTTGIIESDKQIGAISEEYADQLAQNGLRVCYLSVYSHREEEHDWMTKVDGSFNLTRTSISHLIKAGIEVRFNSVITSKNLNQVQKLIELAKAWGVTEVRLLKLINHGRASDCWDAIGITEEEYRRTAETALRMSNPVRITASGMTDIIPCRTFCSQNVCPAGEQLWYITYCGDVYPCASVKNQPLYKMGNIKDEIRKKREGELTNGKFLCKCSIP